MTRTSRANRGAVAAALAACAAMLLSPVGWAAPATQSAPSPTPAPAPGDVVPAFQAEGLDGQVQHVTYPKGSTTVLFFFLSSCPLRYCWMRNVYARYCLT